MARAPLAALFFAVLVALGVACGPISYTSQVTRRASGEVAAAKAVGADKWAPYHYTRATEYLAKAREEASRADFQAANRFGRQSAEDAQKATELSIARSAKGELPGLPSETNAAESPKSDSKSDSDSDRDDGELPVIDAPEAGSE